MVRTSSLVSALLLVSACQKPPEASPAVPPAPEVAPVKAAPFSLSVLQDAAPAGCTWLRLESDGRRRALVTVDAACDGLQLAWSADGKHAAVRDPAGSARGPGRVWMVDLTSGQGAAQLLPEEGLTGAVGFDSVGRLVALTAHTGELVRRDGAFLFDGRRIPLPEEDEGAGLAHAYRLEAGAWKRIETVATRGDADAVFALATAEMLVSSTVAGDPDALVAQALDEGGQDAVRLDAVVPHRGHDVFGGWARMESRGGPLFAWQTAGEQTALMMPVRWEVEDGHLAEPEGLALPAQSPVRAMARGDLLLLTGATQVRVYDLGSRRLVASLNGFRAARFWPEPGSLVPHGATAASGQQ
ncbi:hypothetical protein D7W79_11270 [Corallococcus exercitus]|uniref:hypothetical protein n=1 Tax=Corallococcus exercitus TaxID=2316736 RepID=UPI000EA110D6|nr:hypothetical protein [Corallococcus exercitus]RKG79097.1 hypothetical protein D7W79_11270 [Corallococcus exercitus]